jgi:hypothetical protein
VKSPKLNVMDEERNASIFIIKYIKIREEIEIKHIIGRFSPLAAASLS